MSEQTYEVIIIGGGPVGMFLGLSLAQKNVGVLVLEAEQEIVQSPRALMLVCALIFLGCFDFGQMRSLRQEKTLRVLKMWKDKLSCVVLFGKGSELTSFE